MQQNLDGRARATKGYWNGVPLSDAGVLTAHVLLRFLQQLLFLLSVSLEMDIQLAWSLVPRWYA